MTRVAHCAGGSQDDLEDGAERRLPTLAAARVLLRPNLLVFVLALLLLQGAATVHGAFYPIYLTERVGIHQKWLGQISNLAVFIEIFFVYGCGTLMRRFGIKNLLLAAIALTALRFGLLGLTTNVWVAVGTQVFHGILLMSTGVIPQMVLDDAAEDRFRHSMQGLYVMVGARAGHSATCSRDPSRRGAWPVCTASCRACASSRAA